MDEALTRSTLLIVIFAFEVVKKPRRTPKRRVTKRKRKAPRKKRKSYRSTTKLFKSAGQKTQLQHLRNELRSDECLKKQRYGFRLLWRTVPRDMKRYGIGEEGTFDPANCHRGKCWGWPKECQVTNQQAHTLYFNAYKSGKLTMDQLIVVKKFFSFCWELTGSRGEPHVPGGNYPSVKSISKIIDPKKTASQINFVLPKRIPTVAELKRALTLEWSPELGISFMDHCLGLIAACDLFVFGLRSTEDVKRVKESVQHVMDWANGWMCTSFKGGRAKLCGVKSGTRPWRIYRACHCPNNHIRPPAGFIVNAEGNPYGPVPFCSTCPVAVLEFVFAMQWRQEKRCYPKWLKSGKLGKSNTKDVAKLAIDWFISKGIITESVRYDRNSGRKSLARWCSALDLIYEESFPIHGDLPDVWSGSYQLDMRHTKSKLRIQPTDPKRALVGLRKFANLLGRGKRLKAKLSKSDRFQYHLLRTFGKARLAEKIAHGLPSDSESDD